MCLKLFALWVLNCIPRPLSVRWMWQHFHPELNPVSHDLAVVLRQGHVVAVKVPAPPLPTSPWKCTAQGCIKREPRSDAWVAVVSEQRGETSVACAGELWDVGSSFPEDQNYQVQEDQRRSILMGLGLLWESRQIHSTASGRVHSFKDPWVWDGTAKDQQSGLEKICKHRKSKNGAKEAAEMELRKALAGTRNHLEPWRGMCAMSHRVWWLFISPTVDAICHPRAALLYKASLGRCAWKVRTTTVVLGRVCFTQGQGQCQKRLCANGCEKHSFPCVSR